MNDFFFDDLVKKHTKIPKHLFEFKQCEIDFDKENIAKLLSQINLIMKSGIRTKNITLENN